MRSSLNILAVTLSVAALAVAAFRSAPEPISRSRSDSRLLELEGEVARLSRTLDGFASRPHSERERAAEERSPGSASRAADPSSASPDATAEETTPQAEEQLRMMIDDAVSRKAREVVEEMERKQNKKPSMEVFASTLELTREQRHDTEQAVVRGQQEIYRLLEMPTQDGGNLMNELIEIVARSTIWPGKDHGWGKWLGRVTTMTVPGTNETYSVQIETVKESVRDTLRRTLQKEQYAEFEGWGVDPTEIRDIPGSPQEDLGRRITERAKQLAEQTPAAGPK